jgi:hypothetical protein
MNSKKNKINEKMSEEEYRLNKDLMEDLVTETPNMSKRKFLI